MAAQGELALYKKLWGERPHKCSIKTCGRLLAVFNLRYFSHCVSKGSHPELKLNEKDIDILCYPCHILWENQKDKLVDKPEWSWLFEKYERLKQKS